jgi:hypothetical protein
MRERIWLVSGIALGIGLTLGVFAAQTGIMKLLRFLGEAEHAARANEPEEIIKKEQRKHANHHLR